MAEWLNERPEEGDYVSRHDDRSFVRIEDVYLPGDGPVARSITCPVCGRRSWHPEDVTHGWCAACNAYTSARDHGPACACYDCVADRLAYCALTRGAVDHSMHFVRGCPAVP